MVVLERIVSMLKLAKVVLVCIGLYWIFGSITTQANAENTQPVTTEGYYVQDLKRQDLVSAVTRLYKKVSVQEAEQIVNLAYYHADKHRVKPSLILGIIAVESRFDRKAVSPDGSKGYMQVLPRYHQDKIAGRNIHDAKINIEVGTKILGACVNKHKHINKALACYNGAITPSKARAYVKKVTQKTEQLEILATI